MPSAHAGRCCSCLLLTLTAAVMLTACSFEEPPPAGRPAPKPSGPAVPPASGVSDPCTAFALSLLDGQLDGLPSASPEEADKGGRVADEFQVRYDEVIASAGVEAARGQYADEIAAACGR